MTAPGTLLMAKMLVPETEQPLTAGRVELPPMEKEANLLVPSHEGRSMVCTSRSMSAPC